MNSAWRKDPKDKSRWLCRKCYDSSKRGKRKELEPTSEEDIGSRILGQPPLKRARVERQSPPGNSFMESREAPHTGGIEEKTGRNKKFDKCLFEEIIRRNSNTETT
jgi:hypothetical protein